MIFGDPFKFSLQFDVVEEWNVQDGYWRNGLFSMYVNGERLFKSIEPVELRTTYSFFRETKISEFNFDDFNFPLSDFIKNINNYFMGDGETLENGVTNLTCTAMIDNGINVYYIKSTSADLIMWSLGFGDEISSCILDPGTIDAVIQKLASNPCIF